MFQTELLFHTSSAGHQFSQRRLRRGRRAWAGLPPPPTPTLSPKYFQHPSISFPSRNIFLLIHLLLFFPPLFGYQKDPSYSRATEWPLHPSFPAEMGFQVFKTKKKGKSKKISLDWCLKHIRLDDKCHAAGTFSLSSLFKKKKSGMESFLLPPYVTCQLRSSKWSFYHLVYSIPGKIPLDVEPVMRTLISIRHLTLFFLLFLIHSDSKLKNEQQLHK